jgi:hypothetical protein
VARAPELQRSMFGGHGPGGSQAPQEQKGALGLDPGKRPPPPFLRVWLLAVASYDFSRKMTLGRATGVESNTFFFGPGWFGTSPKHRPLHHMDLAVAGDSLGGGPDSLGAA